MKDEQIIALYFARNEDAIGETDKKYGARLLQLAQRILLDQFACEEVRSDTYLKTWNAIPPQRPPVFPAFLSRLTRQGAIDRYRRDGAQKRGAREYLLSLEELGDAVGGEADEALDARLLAESIERYLRTLSPRERGVFLARYFYVDPLADVARQYGTSIGAVKSLLYRTRQGLRAHLEQESCKQKSIAEMKKSRKICATEKGHNKTDWRKSFASRDKVSI